MHPEERVKAETYRLKKMGIILIFLAILFSLTAYLIPLNELQYWSSSRNKEGIYAISAFFGFLGIYCLGAVWRKRHFI